MSDDPARGDRDFDRDNADQFHRQASGSELDEGALSSGRVGGAVVLLGPTFDLDLVD
jgi:hypothetical protein